MIAIDPGVHMCGEAGFYPDGALAFARLTPVVQVCRGLIKTALVHIEFPRIYLASKQKGDQNDLMQLARTIGNLEERARAAGATVKLIYPRDWKGTIDPDAMIERIKSRLTPAEHVNVTLPTAASLQHNVYDAIGIGLHALGRLAPRKVYPR